MVKGIAKNGLVIVKNVAAYYANKTLNNFNKNWINLIKRLQQVKI